MDELEKMEANRGAQTWEAWVERAISQMASVLSRVSLVRRGKWNSQEKECQDDE
jgi:hypothetical protein